MRFSKGKRYKKKKSSALAALCLLTLLALLLSNGAVTLAKYVLREEQDGTVVAAPFYFSSDKLNDSCPYYPISEPASGEEVQLTFTLANFVDDLRCSGCPIEFTYWASSGSDPNTGVIEATRKTGLLSKEGKETQTLSLTLAQSDFSGGVVTVTARTDSPYEKTISAQFGFAEHPNGLQWTVEEQEGAAVVKLSGGNGNTAVITWPEGLTPDPTCEELQKISSNSASLTAQPGINYALVFLKTDPNAACGKELFTVS